MKIRINVRLFSPFTEKTSQKAEYHIEREIDSSAHVYITMAAYIIREYREH